MYTRDPEHAWLRSLFVQAGQALAASLLRSGQAQGEWTLDPAGTTVEFGSGAPGA